MKYVNAIRRIISIDAALERIPNNDRYDDIWERLLDKREVLCKSVKEYAKYVRTADRSVRSACYNRRKQVLLACNLLGVDYYRNFHKNFR